jgi:hypothetical protein
MSDPHENFTVLNPEIGMDSLLPRSPITAMLTRSIRLVGVDQYPPHSAQNQASPGVSNFADGSGHILSMYLEMATEEDKKMVENWKADADGNSYICASPSSNMVLYADSVGIDWSIFGCCRFVGLSIDSGYSREPTGYLQLLPRKYLSGYYRPKWLQHFEFNSCFPTPFLPSKLRGVGKRTLVLELGNQPYLCTACDVAAAMGTKISQDHSVPLQSTQASTYPCVLCRRRREVSPAMDRRCLARAPPHFSVPIFRRSCRVPFQRPSHDL